MAKPGLRLDPVDKKKFDELMRSLEIFAEEEVEGIMALEANKTVTKMKREAPVDTGRLRGNIEAERNPNGNGVIFDSSAINPETGEQYAPKQDRIHGYFSRNIRKFRYQLHRNLQLRLRGVLKHAGPGARRFFGDLATEKY